MNACQRAPGFINRTTSRMPGIRLPTMTVAGRIGHVQLFAAKMQEQRSAVVRLLMWEIGKTGQLALPAAVAGESSSPSVRGSASSSPARSARWPKSGSSG